MLLSLPRINPDIPLSVDLEGAGETQLRLARSMSRVGLFGESDLANLDEDVLTPAVLTTLIDEVWEREFQDLLEFSVLSAQVTLDMDAGVRDDVYGYDPDGETAIPPLALTLEAAHPTWITVGAAFEALDAAHPGCGAIALNTIYHALCEFGWPMMPAGFLEQASQFHWYGEEDEAAAIEEWGDAGGDTSDILTRAEVVTGMPEWAYGFLPQNTDGLSIVKSALANAGNEQFATMLALTIELLAGCEGNKKAFDDSYQEVWESCAQQPPIVVTWHELDQFDGIIDETMRYAMDTSCPSHVSEFRFQPTPAGVRQAIKRTKLLAAMLKPLDSLLTLAQDLDHELRNPPQNERDYSPVQSPAALHERAR